MRSFTLSVIIPVYYNAPSLPELYQRIINMASSFEGLKLEIIFVNDGSGDDSLAVIKDLAAHDPQVVGLSLSRNFGSFNACLAGLTRATGDCAAIISADLQDPPELLGEMARRWLAGVNVAMAVRERREESRLKIFCAQMYYRLFRLLIDKKMPEGGFDFVLIDRVVVDTLVAMQEKNTTLMGLILWTGFTRAEIPYTRMERKHGKSRWTLWKKVDYFIDSFLAFSKFPIRVFSITGIATSALSFLGVIYIFLAYMLGYMTVAGWPSLMAVVLFMFGLVLTCLGIIGEYLWRTLEETRHRPPFIIEREYRHDKLQEDRLQ